MRIVFRLLRESLISSIQEFGGNKLRSFLSVLGITIGIFCIISVYSAIDSLEKNVRTSFQKLGENVIYIQKFPWNEDPRENWFKYLRRPSASYKEYKALQERLTLAEAVVIMLFLKGKTLTHGSNIVEDADLLAITQEYNAIKDMEFTQGRYLSASEFFSGANKAVIGYNIAEQLFPGQKEVIGKEFTLMKRKVTVVGVLKKEGDDIIGMNYDNNVLIPYNFTKTFIDVDGIRVEPFIGIKAREGVSSEQLMDEIRGIMRAVRKLKPSQPDNFAMNQVSIISAALTAVFGVISLAGGAIGMFSILVGGFGIANIMFVSVKERTPIIGIKKALGARRVFILLEFLTEAVLLCLAGGLIGLALVFVESYVLEWLIRKVADITFIFELSAENIFKGIWLSVGIGLVAGFLPALVASRMNPVEAIRS